MKISKKVLILNGAMKHFILPFRNMIVHPGRIVPIYVEEDQALETLARADAGDKTVILGSHRELWEYPDQAEDIFYIGILGEIVQVLNLPNGSAHAVIRTTNVVRLSDITVEDGIFSADAEIIEYKDDEKAPETLGLRNLLVEKIQELSVYKKFKHELMPPLYQDIPLAPFVDHVLSMLVLNPDEEFRILCIPSWHDKLLHLIELVSTMCETAKVEESINRRVRQQMDNGRREAILQEKMRAIQREMGDDDGEMDTQNMRKRIERSAMPQDVKDKALSEWKRMRNMSPMSAEGGLLKTYLEELLSVPWEKTPSAPIDLHNARAILDSQHSGMDGVKERILEHIAVMKKTGKNQGTILCFVGAPGVGKTSLCKSIAEALGRKYQRISLGGISDEAHFRGHRKTYIGAQMGRIMDALKRCKVDNPVIVLDEIDKIGHDWRGDPESALLEILDPEQNKSFRDHYLEVDFDLSNVLFIATANSLNMSNALKDRMEIIEIPGYNEDDKVRIAREHLIERASRDTGWDPNNVVIDDASLRHLIRDYTSEEGVRELQREITALLRRTLLENDGEDVKTEFTSEKIDKLLSVRKSATLAKRIGFSARA